MKNDKNKKRKKAILVTQYTEWPSSDDSSDDDYIPGDGEDRTESNVDRTKSKRRRRLRRIETEKKTTSHFSDIDGVPVDVWVEIFQRCIKSEGTLPFLVRASRVCRTWYEAAKSAILWQNVDLSFGWVKSVDYTLKWLCENRLVGCKTLNLSGWTNLTSDGLNAVGLHCPNLENIDLSNTSKKLTAEAMETIAKNCPKLSRVNLFESKFLEKNPLPFEVILKHSSNSLSHLTLGKIIIQQLRMNELFNTQLVNCHNLETLELIDITCNRLLLDIEKMQSSFPKLSQLKIVKCPLAFPNVTEQQMEESVGFPELQHLALYIYNTNGIATERAHNILKRLLKNTHNLEILELGQFGRVTANTIDYIVSDKLRFLRLSNNTISNDVTLNKFSVSIEILDLSGIGPRYMVNNLLQDLVNTSDSQLTQVDVSNTEISLDTLQLLLRNTSQMKRINIAQCRELPRGIKRLHINKEIEDLRKKVL